MVWFLFQKVDNITNRQVKMRIYEQNKIFQHIQMDVLNSV